MRVCEASNPGPAALFEPYKALRHYNTFYDVESEVSAHDREALPPAVAADTGAPRPWMEQPPRQTHHPQLRPAPPAARARPAVGGVV